MADAANFADMDSVRVVLAREVTMEAGERSEMHSHPDYFVYFLAAGNVRFTTPSGETREIEVPATENIGGTPVRALFFEPR